MGQYSKRFALIGAAGYVAPRHMAAIKMTGNQIFAALDKSDSVGILDSYFPEADFFTEFERFDRHVDKLSRRGMGIEYLSICSPNYLHDSHIRFGLRSNAHVICEKPLVLNPWNIDSLENLERETGFKVSTILQLRMHPSVIKLKNVVDSTKNHVIHDIDLTYITSRGPWYLQSWKGDSEKSGGIATNIGIHLFDMLHYLFGAIVESKVFLMSTTKASGTLRFRNANVRWFLSIDSDDLPSKVRETGATTYRSICLDGEEVEFSGGFTDLHQKSYEAILAGSGFGLTESRAAIETVSSIRSSQIRSLAGEYHPFLGRK